MSEEKLTKGFVVHANAGLDEVRLEMPHKRSVLLLVAVFLQIGAQMFMTSGMSTFAPAMLGELNGFAYFGLIFTLANLTTAIFNPLGGRLGEIVSKRTLLIIASICNLIEYCGAGFSPSIVFTLATRVIGGIGTGLIVVVGLSLVSDLFPAKKRPFYLGMFATFMAGGVSLGSLIAGIIVDAFSWRGFPFCAGILCIISFIGILIFCPNVNYKTPGVKIDTKGIIFISICMAAVVVWFGLAGNNFAWLSAPSIILGVVTVLSLILFIIFEKKVDDKIAIMPTTLLKNKFVATAFIGSILISFGNLAINIYSPTALQTIMETSATLAGLTLTISGLLAFILGTPIGAWISKKGHIKWFACAGALFQAVACLFGAFIAPHIPPMLVIIGIGVFFGFGNAINNSINVAIVQRYLPAEDAGIAGATVKFAEQFTSTVGVAIIGIIPSLLQNSAQLGYSLVYVFGIITTLAQIVVIFVKLRTVKD